VLIQRLHGEGRIAEARAVQAGANEVIQVLAAIGVYPGVKHALRLRGLDVGASRRPFARLTREQEAKLEAALGRLG
jgi:dihydrodipicolinate synthase/N-acetylneuraminate lyase